MFKRTCEALSRVLMYFGFEALALRVLLATIEDEKPATQERVPFTRPVTKQSAVHTNEPWVLKVVFEDADVPVKGMLYINEIKLARHLYDVN